MIDAITSALQGLNNASQRVERGAANIASGEAPDRIIEDIVDIKQASISYKASIQVLKVVNELSEELIDSFGRR